MTTDPRVGRRVRLSYCADEHTRLEPGARGTVTFIDSMGTVHVRWDDGHQLGLVHEAGDRFDFIDECERCGGVLKYVADFGAPGVGQSWECPNGHHYQRLGASFHLIDADHPVVELDPEGER